MNWQKIKEFFGSEESTEAVFKAEWIGLLKGNVPLYSCLPDELRRLLHERIARFVSSTRFEGCNGLELTERLVDPYGATNSAEFFAVVTETFFEKPKQLRRRRPELYGEMKEFYGLDPEMWLK